MSLDAKLGNGRFRCDWCKKPIPKFDTPCTYQDCSGKVFHFCNSSQLHKWYKNRHQLTLPLEPVCSNTGSPNGVGG